MITITALGIIAIASGFGYVALGMTGAVPYGLLFGAMFLLTAIYGYRIRIHRSVHRPPKARAIRSVEMTGVPATEVRYSTFGFACLIALMSCVTAITLLAAIDFYDSIPPGGNLESEAATVIFSIFGIWLASFLALVLTARIQHGRLVLSRVGIHQRGWTFSSFLPWDAFAGVKAVYTNRPEIMVVAYSNALWEKHQIVKLWKIDRLPPVPMIEVDCTVMAASGETLYWLLKFYVENPEARTELGTEAVLSRARTGEFLAG